jgi:hypothetical protein
MGSMLLKASVEFCLNSLMQEKSFGTLCLGIQKLFESDIEFNAVQKKSFLATVSEEYC